MTRFQIHLFPYGSDNYGVLIHAPDTGETAMIDAGDAGAARAALASTGWRLSHILITHHHGDHTAGLADIKAETGCTVIGPREMSKPIAGIDVRVWDGDTFDFAGQGVRVIATPGHTTDMVNYYFPAQNAVFTGDTLFTLGCGRLFEGTPDMMWHSLSKLAILPPDTAVYGSHEYTLANAAFAETIEPDNPDLVARIAEVKALRAKGLPTVPSTIGHERATNPFLRASSPLIRARLGLTSATDAEVFAEIRSRKDRF